MKIVVSADAVTHPLTGIGYYTLAVIEGLLKRAGPENLCAWQMAKLYDSEAILSQAKDMERSYHLTNAGESQKTHASPVHRLRGYAVNWKWAVSGYQLFNTVRARQALRTYTSTDVFFSPNYLLPPFPGRKVATIADLSTIRHPSLHPASRVSLVNSAIYHAIEHSDALITLSHDIRDDLCDHFNYPQERVFVTHLAARPIFRPYTRSEMAPTLQAFGLARKGYFLSANTIEPRKNIDLILGAYQNYCEEVGVGNALPLLLVGHSGWKNESIFEKMRLLSRKLPIHYAGYVSESSLAKLVSGALATLYMSKYEGFGLPILESMQAGSAVICSNHGSMAEVSGGSARELDCSSQSELTYAMTEMQSDPDLVDRYVKSGLKRAATFSWDKTAAATYEVLCKGFNTGLPTW